MILDGALQIAPTLKSTVTITKAWVESFVKRHRLKFNEQPLMKNLPVLKNRLLEWYHKEKESSLLTRDRITEEAARLAEELNVGKKFGSNWVDTFLKENKLKHCQQPKIVKVDSLKQELLEWYSTEQTIRVITDKDFIEAARNIAKDLSLQINITKGWIESFRRIKNVRLEDQARVKNFPLVQQRLNEWYEIESQFREVSSAEILERGRYLAGKMDVAPAKITDNFVSNWQRKYNILLTESPVYTKRIKQQKDFESDLIKWYNEAIQTELVSSNDVINQAVTMCDTGGYSSHGVNDKSWLESFKKRYAIHFSNQPFYARKGSKRNSIVGGTPNRSQKQKRRRLDNSSIDSELSFKGDESSLLEVSLSNESTLIHDPITTLELEIKSWYDVACTSRVISRPGILAKAKEIADRIGLNKELNDSWVKGFMRRYGITVIDQPVFGKLEDLEEKLLSWHEVQDEPSMAMVVQQAHSVADELGIDRQVISQKYLQGLIKRGTYTTKMSFIGFLRNNPIENNYEVEPIQTIKSESIECVEQDDDSIVEIQIESPPPVDSKAELEILVWYRSRSRKAMVTRGEIIKQAKEVYKDYDDAPEIDVTWVKAFLPKHKINLLDQYMVQQLRELKKRLVLWNGKQAKKGNGEDAVAFAVSVANELEIPLEKITPTYVKNVLKKSAAA